MPITRMTVKYVNPPLEGKSRGTIKDADGNKMLVFPNHLGQYEPGKTYDITYTETGGWKTAQSATAVETTSPRNASTAASSASNGRHESLPEGEFNRQTNPVDSERMFVCAALVAFINAGKVDLDARALGGAVTTLKGLYNYAFEANGGTFVSGLPRQARG